MRCMLTILLFIFQTNAYYVPLARSNTITNKIKVKQIFYNNTQYNIAVGRLSDKSPIAFIDRCPHRGNSFNNSVVCDNQIQCGYHGFQFGLSHSIHDSASIQGIGVSQMIVPCGKGLRRFHVVDHNGIVWLKLHNESIDELPWRPIEDSNPKFTCTKGEVKVNCKKEMFLTNVLDSLHLPHVHVMFGNRQFPEPKDFRLFKECLPSAAVVKFKYEAARGSLFNNEVKVENWFDNSANACSRVISNTHQIKTVAVYACQTQENETLVFYNLYRNFLTARCFDFIFQFLMKWTLREDAAIIENCDTSFDIYKDSSINSKYDVLQILFMKYIQKVEMEKKNFD